MMLYTIWSCFTKNTDNLKIRPRLQKKMNESKQQSRIKNAKAARKNSMTPPRGKMG